MTNFTAITATSNSLSNVIATIRSLNFDVNNSNLPLRSSDAYSGNSACKHRRRTSPTCNNWIRYIFKRKISREHNEKQWLGVSNLVVKSPTDVLEIRIVQEIHREFNHPDANFAHTNATDFGQCVTITMHKHRLEHIRQHVFDLFHIFFEFGAFGEQRFQTIISSAIAFLQIEHRFLWFIHAEETKFESSRIYTHFEAFGFVLPCRIVKIDGHQKGDINQRRH